MSIKTRIEKLEQKLLPNDLKVEVIVSEDGETSEQACKRLGLVQEDEMTIKIVVSFK